MLPPGPWRLPQFVELARQRRPELAIASAVVEEARGNHVQVGLYPNPAITPQIEEIGHNQNQVGEPGVLISQEIVTAGKLRLARAAAAHGIAAADWAAISKWYDVLTNVRIAYVEALTAQRLVETNKSIVAVAENSAVAAQKLLQEGLGNQPDVLRAQVELEQSQVQHANAVTRAEAAWKQLAIAAGLAELPHLEVAGSLESPLPVFEWESLHGEMVARSSQLREANEKTQQAQQALFHARAMKYPNLRLSAIPFYNLPEEDTRVAVYAAVELPIFNRNQGNIYAAQARLTQWAANESLVQLQLMNRLTDAMRRYQIAREKVSAFRQRILPKARESVRLVRIGYAAGDVKYSYTTLLQSQQVLFQAELLYVEALGESWRTTAEIFGLAQLSLSFLDH